MKKRGFTLIELLAVIVILAIIALIATPIVMNVIENSRKGAAERSAENYIDAVETAVATERLDNNILEGEYEIQSDGNLCPVSGCGNDNEYKVNVDMNGNKPTDGTIFIENGQVVEKLTGRTEKTTIVTKDNYTVNYNSDGKLEATPNEENQGSSFSGEVYRNSSQIVQIGDSIKTFSYTENQSELEKDFYLKHIIENNKVKETYACIKYGEDKICFKGGDSIADELSDVEAWHTKYQEEFSCGVLGDFAGCANPPSGSANIGFNTYSTDYYSPYDPEYDSASSWTATEMCSVKFNGESSCGTI